jgi:hypothetical protein
MGKLRSAYSILVGKTKQKRPLKRPRRSWEDKIRMNFREIGWEGVDCMQGSVADPYVHGDEPSGFITGG